MKYQFWLIYLLSYEKIILLNLAKRVDIKRHVTGSMFIVSSPTFLLGKDRFSEKWCLGELIVSPCLWGDGKNFEEDFAWGHSKYMTDKCIFQ